MAASRGVGTGRGDWGRAGFAVALLGLLGCGPSVSVGTDDGSAGGSAATEAGSGDGTDDGTDDSASGPSTSAPTTSAPTTTGAVPTATDSGMDSGSGSGMNSESDGPTGSGGPTASAGPSGSSESGGPPPPWDVLGEWVCSGNELPLFIRLETVEGADLTGTVCTPSDQEGPPPSWDTCDEISNHVPFVSVHHILASLGEPAAPYEIEFGFDYVADTDCLRGFFFPSEAPFVMTEGTCERYVE